VKQRVLITGGNGFVGSFLCNKLKHNFDVFPSTRTPKNTNDIYLDINDWADIESVFRLVKPDIVIHLAGVSSLEIAQKNPLLCITANVEGSKNLIEASLKNQVKTFINFSSNKAVYPKNIYGYTKAIIELALRAVPSTNCNFISYRCGNVIGSPNSFLDQWFRMKQDGIAIQSSGGTAERFFITRQDIVKDILQILENSSALQSSIVTPNMKFAAIADFLLVFEKRFGVSIERTVSRGVDNVFDYLFSSDEAKHTQLVNYNSRLLYVTNNTIKNFYKEALSSQTSQEKFENKELISLIESVESTIK
jgi:FlaA1/EpsC-like NDP-sugar epimerase